jgi:K+-transporting ATPase ATPase A chain
VSLLEFVQVGIYIAAFVFLTPLLGSWMARVFKGERHFLLPVLGWLKRGMYRLGGVKAEEEMT